VFAGADDRCADDRDRAARERSREQGAGHG
jgi:hypothetical protein